MAHHGWGALTGRQREQSAVATVSASSESWEAGWSDALDTRPERVVSLPGFVRKEELIADLTANNNTVPRARSHYIASTNCSSRRISLLFKVLSRLGPEPRPERVDLRSQR